MMTCISPALPAFTYHPDPVATGSVQASPATCQCCGQAREFIYSGPVYGPGDLSGALCPWCIADGSAARSLDASFADSYPLLQAGVPNTVVDEINQRTPGYESWQQEYWLSHCGDACEFHGDASVSDVIDASPDTREDWKNEYQQDEDGWKLATEGYVPRGSSAFYKFRCRHCRMIRLGWDLN